MRALVVLPLTACFGAGPEIAPPGEAVILAALAPPVTAGTDCALASYFGNVAIGPDAAYATTLAYQPVCDGGGAAVDATIPARVLELSKTEAGRVRELAVAGDTFNAAGQRPRVAALAGGAVWARQDGNAVTLESSDGSVAATLQGQQQPANSAAGLVVDATAAYVVTWLAPDGPGGNDPIYPCCNGGSVAQFPAGIVQVRLAPPAVPTVLSQRQVSCELVDDCLVVGADALFYFVRGATTGATLVTQPPVVAEPTPVADLVDAPAGLAIDDAHLAWSSTIDYTRGRANLRRCSIVVASTAPPFAPRTLLDTTAFSCLDLALDGDALYFTITALKDIDPATVMVNAGLGRISIATGELETLALGIGDAESGPRRIAVDGDGLIVVAPLVVARYPKSALDGRHDLVP